MNKTLEALRNLQILATKLYEQNPAFLETWPDAPEFVAAADEAFATVFNAENAYNAHITKVDQTYETFKQALYELSWSNVSMATMCSKLLQDMRDLACVQYDPETWASVKENSVLLP